MSVRCSHKSVEFAKGGVEGNGRALKGAFGELRQAVADVGDDRLQR